MEKHCYKIKDLARFCDAEEMSLRREINGLLRTRPSLLRSRAEVVASGNTSVKSRNMNIDDVVFDVLGVRLGPRK